MEMVTFGFPTRRLPGPGPVSHCQGLVHPCPCPGPAAASRAAPNRPAPPPPAPPPPSLSTTVTTAAESHAHCQVLAPTQAAHFAKGFACRAYLILTTNL